MALITCHECGKEISDAAKVCPQCGAKKKSRGIGAWLLVPVALVIGFLMIGAIAGKNDPSFEARSKARDAIKVCWEEYERKSLAPAEKRFVASTCEMMERDFTQKFNQKP